MKKLIIFSFTSLALLFSATSFAQKNKGGMEQRQELTPEQKAQKQADHLQKKLGLSEDQKQNVYNLNLKRINDTRALRAQNQGSGNKQGNKEGMQKIRNDFDAGMNGILNADQQKTWTQMKADAQAKRAQHQQNKGNKGNKGGNTQAPPSDDSEELDVD